jgi:hypothetical protein
LTGSRFIIILRDRSRATKKEIIMTKLERLEGLECAIGELEDQIAEKRAELEKCDDKAAGEELEQELEDLYFEKQAYEEEEFEELQFELED